MPAFPPGKFGFKPLYPINRNISSFFIERLLKKNKKRKKTKNTKKTMTTTKKRKNKMQKNKTKEKKGRKSGEEEKIKRL